MVPELNCQQCLELIHEHTLGAGNSLELASRLPAAAHGHLQACAACREACAHSVQLEGRLLQLRQELPAPDMRAAVMARIRQGQRAPMPRLAPAYSGGREMMLVMVGLTLLVGLEGPALVNGLELESWFSPAVGLISSLWEQIQWPSAELWTRSWDMPLLLCIMAACAAHTRRWMGTHG